MKTKNTLQPKSASVDSSTDSDPSTLRPNGILDISYAILLERPALMEEKLLRTRGVISAEINVFSNRVRVEFDPSKITLDEIRDILAIDPDLRKPKQFRS